MKLSTRSGLKGKTVSEESHVVNDNDEKDQNTDLE